MIDIIKNSSYGLVITLVVYIFAHTLHHKYKKYSPHPIIITELLLISILLYFKIDYQGYMSSGANIISFFLGPATIVLAIPLFRQWELLKSNALPIIIGVLIGSITGISSIFFLSKLFGLDTIINLSLLAKSVTTPIAMDITELVGGITSITILGVIFAGTFGAIFGPKILKIFGVKNEIAKGIAMGTASHGLGTARAIEEGEIQGAMSGLSVGLTGLATAILIPLMIQVLIVWM
jgi:predicted murein hydrolase (TIGR00659 family)